MVPLCAGPSRLQRPHRPGRRRVGGDNRNSVVALVTLAATLIERKLPHPPPPSCLPSARGGCRGQIPDPADLLARPWDSTWTALATDATIARGRSGAVGSRGYRRRRAGVHPEKGSQRLWSAALAMADIHGGWVRKGGEGQPPGDEQRIGDKDGRSAGRRRTWSASPASRESRSHDPAFATAITTAYKAAFEKASAKSATTRAKS